MWDAILAIILVGTGGAMGAVLRHLVSTRAARIFKNGPISIFVVNLSGCLIIGMAAGLAVGPDGSLGSDGAAWLLLVTGLIGSYTTVSSFSLQTLTMLREGKGTTAFANIAVSLLFCLGATVTGFALTHGFGAMP